MDISLSIQLMVVSFLTTLLIKAGTATTCYACSTKAFPNGIPAEPKCKDPFSTTDNVHKDASCTYGCIKIEFEVDGKDHTGRNCAPQNCADGSYIGEGFSAGITGKQFCCTGNECNGSVRTRASVTVATLAIAASIFGKIYL